MLNPHYPSGVCRWPMRRARMPTVRSNSRTFGRAATVAVVVSAIGAVSAVRAVSR